MPPRIAPVAAQQLNPRGVLAEFMGHSNFHRGVRDGDHYAIRDSDSGALHAIAGMLQYCEGTFYPDYGRNTGAHASPSSSPPGQRRHVDSASGSSRAYAPALAPHASAPLRVQPPSVDARPYAPPVPWRRQTAADSSTGAVARRGRPYARNALTLGNAVERSLERVAHMRDGLHSRRVPALPRSRSGRNMSERLIEFITRNMNLRVVANQVVVFDDETRIGSAIDTVATDADTHSKLVLLEIKTGFRGYLFNGHARMRHELGRAGVSDCPHNQHLLQLALYWAFVEFRWSGRGGQPIVPSDAFVIYVTDTDVRAYRLPEWIRALRYDLFQRLLRVRAGRALLRAVPPHHRSRGHAAHSSARGSRGRGRRGAAAAAASARGWGWSRS